MIKMQRFVPDHRPFLCKFCGDATIVYSQIRDCYIDVNTLQRHVCTKQDYSNLVRTSKEYFADCTLCHSSKNDRVAVFYKSNNCKGTAKVVVCDSCCQKIFRALIEVSE